MLTWMNFEAGFAPGVEDDGLLGGVAVVGGNGSTIQRCDSEDKRDNSRHREQKHSR